MLTTELPVGGMTCAHCERAVREAIAAILGDEGYSVRQAGDGPAALAEIEAALARIDVASYGICEQCGERLRADWLEASPQLRYCRRCRPPRPDRWPPPRGAPGRDHHDR